MTQLNPKRGGKRTGAFPLPIGWGEGGDATTLAFIPIKPTKNRNADMGLLDHGDW